MDDKSSRSMITSSYHQIFKMNNKEQRIEYIDFCRFIGIFLMVLCHAGMHNEATTVIYAFHMPLFFFLSGYLYDRNKTISFFPYIKKKAYSILVPYILCALILCFGSRGLLDWGYLLYSSRDSIAEANSFTPLWFLPCFFISTIVFHVIDKVSKKSIVLFYLLAFVLAAVGFCLGRYRYVFGLGYPGNIDVALVCVLIMSVGHCCKSLNISNVGLLCVGGALLAVGIVLSQQNLPLSLTEGNPHVELSISSYGNVLLFLLNASILCLAVVCLCRAIIWYALLPKGAIRILSFYGANTISVLCFHGILLTILKNAINLLGIKLFGFEPLVITIIIFLVLYPIILFVNSSLPNLVGKRVK